MGRKVVFLAQEFECKECRESWSIRGTLAEGVYYCPSCNEPMHLIGPTLLVPRMYGVG